MDYKTKKTLIIGGAGYIGGFLTDTLTDNGYDVTVYDNLLYEERFLKNVDFIRGDLRDTPKLAKIVNDFDVVVILAAMVGDGACAAEPFIAKHINEIATNAVADMYTRPGGKIIFTSTCSVYGKNDDLIDENAAPNPLSVYAETKLAAEQHILATHPTALAFRLGTLYGVGDEHSRPRFDLVANVLALKAARGEKLTVYGGQQWRPLLHVRDVTTAICYGIVHDLSGLYNLSAGNFSIRHLADDICKLSGNSNVEVVATEMPFEDQRNYKVTNDKILATGWQPDWSFAYGMNQIFQLVREQRIRDFTDPVYSCEHYLKRKYEL